MQRSITTPIPRRTLIAAAVLIVLFAATLVLPDSHQSWAADEISETMYENSHQGAVELTIQSRPSGRELGDNTPTSPTVGYWHQARSVLGGSVLTSSSDATLSNLQILSASDDAIQTLDPAINNNQAPPPSPPAIRIRGHFLLPRKDKRSPPARSIPPARKPLSSDGTTGLDR